MFKNGIFNGQMKILKKTQKANILRDQQLLFFNAKKNNMFKEKKDKNQKTSVESTKKSRKENRQKIK